MRSDHRLASDGGGRSLVTHGDGKVGYKASGSVSQFGRSAKQPMGHTPARSPTPERGRPRQALYYGRAAAARPAPARVDETSALLAIPILGEA
jgi:hypothetical protein